MSKKDDIRNFYCLVCSEYSGYIEKPGQPFTALDSAIHQEIYCHCEDCGFHVATLIESESCTGTQTHTEWCDTEQGCWEDIH